MQRAFDMPATIEAVDPMVGTLTAIARGYLSEAALTGFEVAVCEALANVVTHAFETPSEGPVAIEIGCAAEAVTVVLTDRGRSAPSDLFENAAALETVDVMAENGRGLPLIDHFADAVSYRSEGGVNRLTLVFRREDRA